MDVLAYYLIASFISIYLFNPKSKNGLWKRVIILPLIITIFIALYALTMSYGDYGYSTYKFGKMFSKCIIPLIISLRINYIYLSRKMNTGNMLRFPMLLLISIIFTIILSSINQNF